MTTEQKNNIISWIAALRSGDYKQGFGCLYSPSVNAFCCFGVACELNQLPKSTRRLRSYIYPIGIQERPGIPGNEWFQSQYGFSVTRPFILSGAMTLDQINDNKILDFKGIADLLEKTFIHSENEKSLQVQVSPADQDCNQGQDGTID